MATEKRLIDAIELTDRLNHTTMVAYPNLFPGLLAAVEVVDDSPTVDAVEVIRCKNCKHFNMQRMQCENEDVHTDNEGGADYSIKFYLDDFCSYGERRTE